MIFQTLLRDPLDIKRPIVGEGYYDKGGDWVTAFTVEDVPDVLGSVQPYNRTDYGRGEITKWAIDGTEAQQIKLVFTNQLIYSIDDREPDELHLDGYTYVCIQVQNYMKHPLSLKHCECVFIRRDKLSVKV